MSRTDERARLMRIYQRMPAGEARKRTLAMIERRFGPEGTGPLRRMYADVMFLDPAQVNAAAAEFIRLGFDFER